MSAVAGALLGHYRLVEPIGEGGMATVWRAEDTRLGRDVAVKLLPPRFANDPDRIRRLEHEARAVAALQHPNIVTLHSVEEIEGVRFLTMEYVRGRTLDEIVPEGGLPLPDFYRLAIAITDAIDAAHRQGIVHRDLKPKNVMVDGDGVVKVLDFGLAVSSDATAEPEVVTERPQIEAADLEVTITLAGNAGFAGTLPYMSPEQVRGENPGPRSDLFSLGVLLYEMLTGRRPFGGDTLAERAAAILRDDPIAPGRLRSGVPRHLDRVLQRCMAKEVARRIESARRLGDELRALERDARTRPAGGSTSIAVLPFADHSEAGDQAHLCEGIAEELINALTRATDLRVAARSSAFRFASGKFDGREVADRLGVTNLLEGSIRKAGDRLRVTAELIDAADGAQIWSNSFDRPLDDVFAIQEEITRAIVQTLDVRIGPRERRALRQVATEDARAYEYYLRGRRFYAQFRRRGVELALRMYRRAIDLDPAYALAYAGVAECRVYLYMNADPVDVHRREADEASRIALELDPESPEAHTARGLVLSACGRIEEAQEAFKAAIGLDPRSFDAHYHYGRECFTAGRTEDAIREYERASTLRPDDFQAPLLVSQIYEDLGRRTEATDARRRGVRAAEHRLDLHPDDTRALYMGANGWVGLSEIERGLEWARRARDLEPDEPMLLYNLGCIHAMAGEPDVALDCLDHAIAAGFRHRPWFEHDSNLDSIRDRPEFGELLARIADPRT